MPQFRRPIAKPSPGVLRAPVHAPAPRPTTSRPAPPPGNLLQSFCAQAALFLLPLPALKYTATTITLADLFLVPAIVMNLGYALRRMHAFQIPFLLAFPLFLLSHMLDADGELISLLQICYLWGLLVPFGWCAFVNVPVRRIAVLLLAANLVSAVFAMGQFGGFLPDLPTQNIIYFRLSLKRAAGLMLQCNSLAMSLCPCFLLLPYLPRVKSRIGAALALLLGLASTVSKSIVFAIPGMLFYFFWREPEKRRLMVSAVVVAALGVLYLNNSGNNLSRLWDTLNEAAMARLEGTGNSYDERSELARIALDYSQECVFLGFGTEGMLRRVSQSSGNTVHVFYLGLVVMAGYPAATLVVLGLLMIAGKLWLQREYNFAIYLVAQMLAICVMTVLYLSFEYAPFMVAASVLVSNERQAKSAAVWNSSVPKVGRRAA